MGVDEFGLRADDHDSSLRTNSEGKTWRPRSATSDLGSRVGPQVASLRTSPSRVELTASLTEIRL